MDILAIIKGEKHESPEAIAGAIAEMEAKFYELNQQFQEAENALMEREQANMLGRSAPAGEIDALEKKRDRANRQLGAAKDVVAKLRNTLQTEIINKLHALQEEDQRLTSAITAGVDKIRSVAEEHYIGLLLCVMAKTGGVFYPGEFFHCPFFPSDRLNEIEKVVRDKFANLSKGPLLEQSRIIEQSNEVNSLLRGTWSHDPEKIAESLIDKAREKVLSDNTRK